MGALVIRWWRMFRTATAWLFGRILLEAPVDAMPASSPLRAHHEPLAPVKVAHPADADYPASTY